MRILYFNNCWFTNVGEAFVDIGGMEIAKRIFPGAKLGCISAMSDYYARYAPKGGSLRRQMTDRVLGNFIHQSDELGMKTARMNVQLTGDYVIIPGMVATKEYLSAKSRVMIDELAEKGCKIIFLGLGGYEYTEEEKRLFSEYLEVIKPSLVVTRDEETYETYKNVTQCIKGLDNAFWVKDTYDPRGFAERCYDIVAFNRSKEPDIFDKWENEIIRPRHMQYSYDKTQYVDNILISDSPYDYLTLYGNANQVYTDLVHASIVSLMYGVPVKYWFIDKRSLAFNALNSLQVDDEGWMSISSYDLEKQKEEIIKEIVYAIQ